MNLSINLNKGIGPIYFGVGRNLVYEILGDPQLRIPSVGKFPMDAFIVSSRCVGGTKDYIKVDYDEHETVNAIEVFSKNLFFQNTLIANWTYVDFIRLIRSLSSDVTEDCAGFESRALGIGIYAPPLNDLKRSIEGIICFSAGYYSNYLPPVESPENYRKTQLPFMPVFQERSANQCPGDYEDTSYFPEFDRENLMVERANCANSKNKLW